jgi:TolB-like protein/Tfp pilus assembly protein PilF
MGTALHSPLAGGRSREEAEIMRDMPPSQRVIRFGEFEVDLQAGFLSKRGVKVRLRQQLFVVLSTLLERAGEVVTREELQKRLWPGDVVVDFEIDLNTIMARLREALGDSTEYPRYIETLPKRGYRFLVPVSEYPASEPVTQRRIRIVVLPLSNVSGNPAEEYFSDAMTDEIISALCRLAPEQLAVIARTTAMHYRGSEKDVAHIGRELGVDYVVEGGVRRSDNQVAMNVQLIQTADQTHVFARKYDAELRDIFKVVNRAASDIADSIGINAGLGDKREGLLVGGQLRRKPTEDLVAYNEYIQARCYMEKGTAENFAEAKQHLERAIARDPKFALAYDALAEINWYLGYLGYIPARKAFSAGIIQALRAIEIDNTRAETHALLGAFHKTIEYNWAEVHREMALALRLDPTSPLVRLRYAVSDLMPHGRLEEAIAEIKHALESDPLSILAQSWLGVMLVLAHEWDLAIDQAHRVVQLDPTVFYGHFVMGVAYRAKQMFEKAITAQRMAVEVSGGAASMIGWLGLILGLCGKAPEARSLLRQLHSKAEQGYVPPTSFAWIYLGLREIDTAFQWLNRAVEECDQFMMPIKTYVFFDPIRADPRFMALLRKMNLEP